MISQNKIADVVNKIVSDYQPEKIMLFGSYQNGVPDDESDLDLLIIKQTDLRKFERATEVKKIFDSYPCPMDIVVFTPAEFENSKGILNTLAYIVEKNHRVLYAK